LNILYTDCQAVDNKNFRKIVIKKEELRDCISSHLKHISD